MASLLRKSHKEENMLERIIAPGDKVEMKSVDVVKLPDGTQGVKKYQTTVHDILDDGRIELVMPMEKTKLILLPMEGEYEIIFFTSLGMYQGIVRIAERRKEDNIYLLVADVITTLKKFQRREFYRLNTVIDAKVKMTSDNENHAMAQGLFHLISQKELWKAIIVDISGGGARFVSKQACEPGQSLYMNFELPIAGNVKKFQLAAVVISSKEIEKHPGEKETRVKFQNLENTMREEIIKYIFDEERKNRKNGKR